MPGRRISFAALVFSAALPAACGRGTAPAPPRSEAAAPRPTAPPRPAYKPPADGRVTKPQVEAYLGVLEALRADRSRGAATGPPAPGDPLDVAAPDVAVARARGLNAAEYLWVRERVLEAEAGALSERLHASHLAMLERALAELKTRRAAAPDEGSKKLLSEQIANFDAEVARTRREAREKEAENVRANMRTIEPYRARLETAGEVLDQPVPRAAGVVRSPAASPAPAR